MRKITFITVLIIFTIQISSFGQTLTMKVRGIEKKEGTLFIGIYNSSKTFLKKSLYGYKQKINDLEIDISFTDIPKGVYAISIYQDENNNGKLDTGLFGIPLELYGFSGDVKGFLGPPSFKECVFQFMKDTTITINL